MPAPGLAPLLVAATLLLLPSPGAAAAEDSAPATPPPPAVDVRDGQLTVTVQDADLAEVLALVAERAGFELKSSGNLGRVTASLSGVPVDEGVRRLAQEHELVLVYRRARPGQGSTLAEVRVFAARLAPAPAATRAASRGATMAEISRLARARGDANAVARLAYLLASDPEATIRARAAWALSRAGTAAAGEALGRAVQDPEARVRVQVVYGLSRAEGARAVPTLASVLQGDPDAGVRRAAARALGGLPSGESAAALQSAVQDPDAYVRNEAARALRRQGMSRP